MVSMNLARLVMHEAESYSVKLAIFKICMNRAIDLLSRYGTPFEIGFLQPTLRFQIHMLKFIGFG